MGTEVYKVVSRDGVEWVSAFDWGEYTAKYRVGVDTFPPIGHLYAFADEQSARMFLKAEQWSATRRIFHAEADTVDAKPVMLSGSGRLWEFWKGTDDFLSLLTNPAPLGTVWCSRIRLLEEVKW